MQRTFSFIAGAFCGALVGSVAALLLAPMSGRELQVMGRTRTDAAFAE
ncbi:MAG: YtxH domain-containing protein, partial [Chloroflexi bacterium]|nr:YtxH domain-containing protein [Chloroflexota bacterium]